MSAYATCLARRVDKFTLKFQTLSHACRCFRSQINIPYGFCSSRTNSWNNPLRNRSYIGWKSQGIFDRGRHGPASLVRAFKSGNLANDGEVENKGDEKSSAKKQLKTEDLFRILSLAKPEYKSLAGMTLFTTRVTFKDY